MDQFLVPQFIDVEDKVIGPITVRQFIILLITGGLIFITYKLADFTLFILLSVFFFAIGGILAFARINGQPFHYFLLNFAQTAKRPGRRVWNKNLSDNELYHYIHVAPPLPPAQKPHKEALSKSRLTEISLIVDTGGVYNGEE